MVYSIFALVGLMFLAFFGYLIYLECMWYNEDYYYYYDDEHHYLMTSNGRKGIRNHKMQKQTLPFATLMKN